MKQTKWQRLATIGLCSSLVINAFSGVTAVAETITIESSPTVASSAKEATSASSATQESTESSQETTETSREEVTQETEKPEEITKTSDSKIDMVDPLNNSLQNSPTVAPKATVAIPSQVMDFAIVDEENNGVALTTPITGDSQWVRLGGSNGLVGSVQSVRYSTTYAGKNVFFNRITIPGVNYSNTVNFAYGLRNVTITLPKWYKGLSFVKPSYSIYPPSFMISYKNNGQQVTSPSQIVDKEYAGVRINLISQPNVYQVIHSIDGGVGSTPITFNNVYRITAPANTAYTKAKMVPQTSTGNYNNIVYIYTTKRKVTENFVDINGTKITPPTGFTQGKQTVIDSDPYTFKQAGTLPDTYQADGKTYKFKGWYKGKTKPNTLTTTKAPSYAVTYDDNDDLNVVYEEIEAFDFPALTYQFGFVGEDGKLANPADINLTYDYKSIVFRGTGAAGSTVSFGTIANNQSGVKVGNLRQVTLPAKNIEQPTVVGWTGEAFANFSIKLPKYYKSLNLYDKTGKIDPKYPLPVKATVSSLPNNTVQPEAGVIADLTLTQRADGSFTPRETYSVSDSSVRYPSFLRRFISYGSGIATAVHQTISGPVYYHLTNRRVTENFVDATGTKIAPPTGFTQGKQTVINSDPYTFKQSGTLPDTYTTGGKTYKFKGWYKGKTKPNTLTTTKAPSYAVTYDDNDDLNVVYEEIEAFDFPALTYQFGFVGEDGKLANPADINITYDYTGIEVRGNGGADSNVSFKTIASNQSGTTVGNFKQVIFPASSIERPTTTGWNGDGFSEFSIKLPKYYESVNLYDKTGKINTNYPLPRVTLVESNVPDTIFSESTLISDLALTQKADKSYTLREVNVSMNPNIKYPNLISRNINSLDERDGNIRYKTIEGPIYYHLTNRRVTENFVDTNGTKITPPTGFTQGKQTVINSDPYTFKQSGTLPDTYTTGGKTYKFKGWYKGKSIINTLTTTKAPSYAVTYDDNDDLNVVYEEETVTPVYPSMNVNFVDEQGVGFTPALTFSGKYRVQRTSDMLYTDLYDLMTKNNGNGQYTFSLNNGSMPLSPELFNAYANSIKIDGLNKLIFDFNQISIANQLKYVDNIELDTIKSKLNLTRYTYTSTASTVFDINQIPVESSGNSDNILSFANNNGFFTQNASALLYMDVSVVSNSIRMFGFNAKNAINSTAVYTVTRKQVTENFVDTNGTKITPPTGFTQGNQIPMTSNTFKYTAARALPATYTAGGKTYTFQGWYKGKTKPNTLTTSTTPTYNTTFDGNDDMTAMYKEEVPKASVALTRTTAETVTSGGNVTWRATITNTSQAPLTTATIKKSTAWTT
ncbi:hypothetical protein ACSSIR_002708, partial [Enterococcus faecalis]